MTSSWLEVGLPANLDAERLVLGAILLNGDRYAHLEAVLVSTDFSLEKHRRIFARMADLYQRGESIDRVTIADELIKRGQLESIDGLSYLVSLDDGLPEIANLDSYVRIVKEKSLLRNTIFACQRTIDPCALASEPSEEILKTAAALLDQIAGTGAKREQWVTPWEVLQQHGASLLCPAHNTAGMKTPWLRLTEMTSGWNPGDLIIIGGRPGAGKSVIGMQQAHTSASQGIGVAYFSLEMSKESLVRRRLEGDGCGTTCLLPRPTQITVTCLSSAEE